MVAWCCATVVLTSLIPAAILRRGGHDAVVPTSLVAIRATGLMGSGRGLLKPLGGSEPPFHQFAGRCWSRHSLYPARCGHVVQCPERLNYRIRLWGMSLPALFKWCENMFACP